MSTASLVLEVRSDSFTVAEKRHLALVDSLKQAEAARDRMAEASKRAGDKQGAADERAYQAYLKAEAKREQGEQRAAQRAEQLYLKRQAAYEKEWKAAEQAASKELESLRRQLYTEEEWIKHSAEKRRQIIMSNALITEAERSKLLDANSRQGSNRLRDMLPGAGAAAGAHLEGIATAAVYAGGALVTGLAVHEVAAATKEYEGLLTVLEGATGSAEKAKAAFDELEAMQASELFGENKMTDAFVKLRDVGLNPSARALQAYADLAAAKGKDVTDVSDAIAGAALGSGKALKALQIGMKADGDQIEMTFRGVKTTIANDAKAIEQYMISLSENNFGGAVARKMETLAGATAALKDSWGDLAREIGKSGVAQMLIDIARAATMAVKAANDLTTGAPREKKRDKAPDEYVDEIGVKRKYTAEQMKQFQEEIQANLTGFYAAKAQQEQQAAADSNSALGISEKERRDIMAGSYEDQLADLRKNLRTKAEIAEEEFQKQRAIILKNPNAAEAETMMREAEARRSAATPTVSVRSTKTAGAQFHLMDTMDALAAQERRERTDRTVEEQAKAAEAYQKEYEQLKDSLAKQEDSVRASYEKRRTFLESYLGEDQQDLWARNEELWGQHLDKLAETEADKQAQRAKQRSELLNTDDSEIGQINKAAADKVAALEAARADELITLAEFEQAKTAIMSKAAAERSKFENKQYEMSLGSASAMFGSFAQMAKEHAGEQSNWYRVTFALSKSFAVAQATLALGQSLAEASKQSWPANLALYVQAAAQGAQIISQITSTNFTGAMDAGGYIPAGSVGLVGERRAELVTGPTLVRGPAQVTGGAETARMMAGGGGGDGRATKVYNILDSHDLARSVVGTAAFGDGIVNYIKANRSEVRSILG